MTYTQNEKAIIWLSLFEKLTLVKAKMLLSQYSEPKQIIENLEKDKNQIIKIVGESIYYKMLKADQGILNSYLDKLQSQGIICLTIASSNFPEKLMEIKEAPIILFTKGDLGLLNKKAVAIVGTRKPTAYGRELSATFAQKLSKNGVVIVSGLASGVDKFAHEASVKSGKTIAVLGGGFNHIYPAMNTNLAEEIAKKGLLITEYRPDIAPTKYSFPFRNRIISALSDGVFIAEAGAKSGALYTKDYALKQGKLVFVAPANINNPRAEGSNNVLKNREGIMVTCPEDILASIGVMGQAEEPQQQTVQLSVDDQAILSAIEDKPQTFDELQNITKLPSKILSSCLTMLQIRGLIKKLPGNEYSL